MNTPISPPARLAPLLARPGTGHEPGAPLLATLATAAGSLPAGPGEAMACKVLETLRPLRADPEVQAAAALHLWPALREALPAQALAAAPRVGRLLEGLAAAGQVDDLHHQRQRQGSAEGLRRLLLALVRDLRAVLVLLAIQLVRLRDAGQLPADERRALAELARDIHAPLANRLGIWQLKWELEDLAFRWLEFDTYQRIARLLDEKRGDRERFIDEAMARIRAALAEAGIRGADVAGRPKHIYSIWKKMQRKGLPFSELYDIRAIRVLVDDIPTCYAVLGVVHQLWPSIPSEFDDYIAHPKGNDYRSLHTAVVGPGGRTLEVQIRTREMHEHAELGVAAHWRYKEGGGADASFERKVAWMRQLLEAREEREDSLVEGFSTELVEDRVYALTPRGEVVDLPRGATVLDFAYAVHTEVGHRCRGAKVNGRIVPLDHRPATGDQVEILTAKAAEPRRDWLLAANGFLATGRARDKVRAWFHKIDRARNLQAGKELLEKELRRVAMMQADLAPVLAKFRLDTVDDLHLALALGDLGPSQVSRALHDHAQAAKAPAAEAEPGFVARRPSRPGKTPFEVEGVGNLLSQIARCCQPVPGDPIVGYLTRGRGVSIHRAGCPALQRLLLRQPDRMLPVEWGGGPAGNYEVDILVRAFDRKWLLKDLTNAIAQLGVNILGLQSRVDPDRALAELRLAVRVADFGQLSDLLGRLNAIPGVQEAHRLG
ncbi:MULTISPECIES: bifunctional (p)ppGpp synthetase/guanosine-3',5'-bis(diphosphate) 3'-pyrophosphohydrolase [unclassified Arenimonas]|uniref:bifunctional (p)ppGpp synthetase/guanosine-3',5'-bis(diphosphate) 3'-pyrophosphohydrolase n=1 Tax=unclassified Arenimonas TaxID=2641713 RepID=UPI00086F1A0D|nr:MULTISPECIES: bifunctional (p)ppGpp synthetase/guanosine-3',5'-bis(diphosphate) 3'-pyrophosphohydrolase [unclassified Arenimonas]ODS63042.1 MAG: GTP diphosphokinase [Arenimonas sp. SCN 70-307]